MSIGSKIKKIRLDNGLTQEDFAKKIFVTRTAVSKWECDKGIPGIDSLMYISKAFCVPIADLINDSGERCREKEKAEVGKGRGRHFLTVSFISFIVAVVFSAFADVFFYGAMAWALIALSALALLIYSFKYDDFTYVSYLIWISVFIYVFLRVSP